MKTKLGVIVASFLALATFAGSEGRQAVPGHVPAAVARSHSLRRLEADHRLQLAIALPLRDKARLTNLLQQIYDPASPNHGHYLTAAQFAERFGPTEADYQALREFAKSHHLTEKATHPNRTLLDVEGSVAEIEAAFHTTMRVYQHPSEDREFYAPETEPSLDLTLPVLHISGLDNYLKPHPASLKSGSRRDGNAASPASGTAPNNNYMGADFRAAYAPGVALTGTGQTVGLLELDSGFYESDITAYETLAGFTNNVPVTAVLIDGYDGGAGSEGGNPEVSLDIETAISMAPGLSSVLVYEGAIGDDVLNRMATDNIAKQLSASWAGYSDAGSDQIFLQFATQGQSFFNASGDGDAWAGSIDPPCDDPNITIVGGTTLTMSGRGASWSSEKVWNWGYDPPGWWPNDDYVGSGGGISTSYAIPTWQQGVSMALNGGSTTRRNIPDVALTADNIWVTFSNGVSGSYGGTSCAAPLWAGFIALVNQQSQANGGGTVGFINPAVYAIGQGANYTNCFNDITTGSNAWPVGSPTNFFAVTGYDLCTGWGTPRGSNLINVLAPGAPSAAPAGATLYWDPAGKKASPGSGGSGAWSLSAGDWWLGGSSNLTWAAAGDNPIFAGNAGTVTVSGAVGAGGLVFNTAGYVVNGSGTLTLSNAATISLSNAVAISCKLAGAGYTVSGGGALTLSNTANSITGPIIIGTNTTLAIAASAAIGSGAGTITLGNGGTLQNNDLVNTDAFLNSALNIALGTVGGNMSDSTGASLSYGGVISGAGSLIKTGGGALTLSGVNTYSGTTAINQGTLALGGAGSINNSPLIIIGAGGTFDVSAFSSWTLGSQLQAAGNGVSIGTTAAGIKGASGGLVSFGSHPVTLVFTPTATNGDLTHPPLYISLGTLVLGAGNAITISNASGALGAGSYRLIQQISGNISGAPNATPVFLGAGTAAGTTSSLAVSGPDLNLTILHTTTTTLNALNPSTYGQSITFTATISPTPSGGKVQFYDNGVALGGLVTEVGGQVTYTTSALAAGGHPISAIYNGVGFFASSSTAAASTQIVNPAPLGITANSQSKTYGTFLALGAGSTNFSASGLLNGETVGSVTLTSSGNGTNAPVGTYSLTPSLATGGTFAAANYNIAYNPATLTVTLPPNTIPVTITSAARLGNGEPQLFFSGTPGYIYLVETATNLTPVVNWTVIGTNAADGNGQFSFIDTNTGNFSSRYYRTATQ